MRTMMRKITAMMLAFTMLLSCIDTNVFLIQAQAESKSIPEGAVEYNGHYYYAFSDGYEWKEAEEECEAIGGHLVTITSEEEQSVVEELLAGGDKNSYWIGGYKSDNIWYWITGEDFDYTNWANNQPDNYTGNENSLMIYRNENPNNVTWLGAWNDLDSDGTCRNESFFGLENFGYICEWDDYSVDSSNIIIETIPDDAEEYNGHYYKIYTEDIS